MNQQDFHAIVSGQRRGAKAALARLALSLAEVPYTLAVRYRNRRYDRGASPIQRVNVPVVSVGNLTLGGTGKTPLVEWLARWFRAEGLRVTIVSRGYKAEQGARNDEALELEQRLPDVPHVQNADRVAAARLAIEEFETQVIVLDDGFQHRRLARDLDIVLLDALSPFGYGHVFPRGTLREPAAGLRRASVIGLSRSDLLSAADRDELRQRVQALAPQAAWLEMAHRPNGLLAADGRQIPLETLRGQRVAAFCGIGSPAGFQHTLSACGCAIAGWREFPDHHPYQRSDVDALARWVRDCGADAAVCTHKDLVKLGTAQLGERPLWAVGIALAILSGEEALTAKLRTLAEQARGA